MNQRPHNFTGATNEGFGLRFLNEKWNDSISNGHPFTIRWNESLDDTLSPELGLFKITYPKNGVAAFELISNLTDGMNNKDATCLWTPDHLDDELYTLWLTSTPDTRSGWTASPPWRLTESPRHSLPWAAPVVIPIIVILTVYTLGLTACITYRRHRKNKREKESNREEPDTEEADEEPSFFREGDRHPSVDTVLTIESLDSILSDKQKIWLLTQSASGSLLLSSSGSRKNSDATLVSPTALLSDTKLISPISSSEQTLQSPTSVHSERTLVTLSDPRDRRPVVAGRQGHSLRIIIPSSDEQD
ncbi:hypothetical protein TRIATDRAFT_41175 [Trichoderma atroviride IMI 206040]|uniref:Uncharacterized protein n=1 Tax=Hypocrea atroviridis (strain ATCC 20476 / IMI 206040) TaxID=452589 RepID=G9NUU3_HYPAI|nr:uncharacterized protein TRIATDRAFT_41175 [Trichoderma atroviride IMI 206040]EHK45818.1 hypothetical protein TRIATDRAFT_41175 [Trichoderma atroviride IMI 206040]